MTTDTLIHRASMVFLTPFVWLFATIAYLICAPITAAEEVADSFRRHWKDQ